MSGVFCPHCWREHRLDDLVYGCECSENPLRCAEAEKPGRVFQLLSRNAAMVCGRCGEPVQALACPNPNCGEIMPTTGGRIGCDLRIGVIGAPGSGKTTYLTALDSELSRVGLRMFNWLPPDPSPSPRNRLSGNQLRQDKEKKALGKTGPAWTEPLMFSHKYVDGSDAVTYSMYDTPGDAFLSSNMEDTHALWLKHLTGLIYLIDPTGLEPARDLLGPAENRKQNNAPGGMRQVEAILEAIIARASPDNCKIGTRLAVCFSKADCFRSLVPDLLIDDGGYAGGFSIDEFRAIDEAAHAFAMEWLTPHFHDLCKHFSDTAFFMTTALGGRPDAGGSLPHEPRPGRVLDPLLWLLWKHAFIK